MDNRSQPPSAEIKEFESSDGYKWKYRSYLPQSPMRGRVICLHGIQSHSGWYEASSQKMAEAGFAVSFLDRRGSGLNEQARGDTPSFRRLFGDLAEFILQQAHEDFPRVVGVKHEAPPLTHLATPPPIFLLGISWGGKLAVGFLRRHPKLADGLILLAPGICPKIEPKFGEKLKIAWSSFVRPGRYFPIPLNDPELFTANPERLEFLREDSLSLREATARFLAQSRRLDWYLAFAKKHVTVPALLMLAEQDRIIDNDRTRKFVSGFATDDITIKEYLGAHHTLEFEPDPTPIFDDLVEWLCARAPVLKKTTNT